MFLLSAAANLHGALKVAAALGMDYSQLFSLWAHGRELDATYVGAEVWAVMRIDRAIGWLALFILQVAFTTAVIAGRHREKRAADALREAGILKARDA